MKKILSILLVSAMAASMLASCGSEKTTTDTDDTAVESVQTDSGSETSSGDESETSSYVPKVDIDTSVTLKAKELLKEAGVTVKVTGLKFGQFTEVLGPMICFSMKNTTDHNMFVRIEHLTVNGCMNQARMEIRIKPGASVDEELPLIMEDLELFDIGTIAEITFDMALSSPDERVKTLNDVKLLTSKSDYKQKIKIDGDVVLENEYVKIYYIKNYTDDYYSYCDYVIYNKSDMPLRIGSEYIKVNDKELTSQIESVVKPGTYVLTYITLDHEMLTDLGIESIDNVKFKLQLFDLSTYVESYDTLTAVENTPVFTSDEFTVVSDIVVPKEEAPATTETAIAADVATDAPSDVTA